MIMTQQHPLLRSAMSFGNRLLTAPFTRECLRRILRRKVMLRYNRWCNRLSSEQIARLRQRLTALRTAAPRGRVVVYLSCLPWKTVLFQRPHQLARALARLGDTVLFCYPADNSPVEFTEVEPNLFTCPHLDILEAVTDALVIVYYVCDMLHLPKDMKARRLQLLYDYLDDITLTGFHHMHLEFHRWLVTNADLQVVTADQLYRQVHELRGDALLLPNAVDYATFHLPHPVDPPEDLAPLLDKPIIGYHGVLAKWFDYDLLRAAALAHPECNFVLIGPTYHHDLTPYQLDAIPNIHLLGARDHTLLPRYTAFYTVGIIPFIDNEITRATSPVKLFEYLAAGCPVVTTSMPECRKYDGVTVAANSEEFITAITHLLAGQFDRARIDATARENDWLERAREIQQAAALQQETELAPSLSPHNSETATATKLKAAIRKPTQ